MLSKVPICAATSWAKGCICCCCIWTGTEPPNIQRRDMKRSKILHSSKCRFSNEFRFLFYESGESEPRTKQSLGYRWIQLGQWSLAACCSCCAWIVVPSPENSLESAFPSHSCHRTGTWKPLFWWSSFSSPVAEKRLWKLLEIGWLLRKLLLEVIALLVLSLPWHSDLHMVNLSFLRPTKDPTIPPYSTVWWPSYCDCGKGPWPPCLGSWDMRFMNLWYDSQSPPIPANAIYK